MLRRRFWGVRNVLVGSRSLILSQMRDPILRRSVVKPITPTRSYGSDLAAAGLRFLLLVLERHVHASAIGRDLALLDGHVEPGDFANPEIAQRLARGLHGILDRVLPGYLARSHQIRHPIDAVTCHGLSPCWWWSVPIAPVLGDGPARSGSTELEVEATDLELLVRI